MDALCVVMTIVLTAESFLSALAKSSLWRASRPSVHSSRRSRDGLRSMARARSSSLSCPWEISVTFWRSRLTQSSCSALSQNRPLQWALEFLQSGQIDGATTLWDEMFLPSILESALLQYGSKTGLINPDTSNSSSTVEPKNNLLFSVLTGLFLGLISFLLLWRSRSGHLTGLYKAYSFTVNLVFGLLGTLLLFMMCFTNHNVTWYNENLLFVNPILIAMAIMTLRRKPCKVLPILYRILLAIMAILVVLKLVLPAVFLQDNWCVLVMLAPYYAVNIFAFRSIEKRTGK